MKKSLLTFVVTAILLCAMAFCVSAEDAPASSGSTLADYYPNTQYSYNITYNVGAANAGKMYGMVAITETAASGETPASYVIDEAHIVYIDQATADTSGNITFSGFAPKGKAANEEGYVESRVFIGGESIGDTAQAIGTLKTYDETKVSKNKISGTVTDTVAGTKKEATVTVMDGTTKLGETTTVSGAYSIELASTDSETVTVVFTKPSFLSLTYTSVPVDTDVTLNVDISALSGDVDGSGQILMPDVNKITGNFRAFASTLGENATADVDGSGQVLMPDVNNTTNHFRASKKSVAYSAN